MEQVWGVTYVIVLVCSLRRRHNGLLSITLLLPRDLLLLVLFRPSDHYMQCS